jgi:hypothetical protein
MTESPLEATTFRTFVVQRWIRVGLHAGLDLLDLLVRQPCGGADGLQGQPEELQGCCLRSRVTVGEAGNELCLLAAQVLGEVDEACHRAVGHHVRQKEFLIIAAHCTFSTIKQPALVLALAR